MITEKEEFNCESYVSFVLEKAAEIETKTLIALKTKTNLEKNTLVKELIAKFKKLIGNLSERLKTMSSSTTVQRSKSTPVFLDSEESLSQKLFEQIALVKQKEAEITKFKKMITKQNTEIKQNNCDELVIMENEITKLRSDIKSISNNAKKAKEENITLKERIRKLEEVFDLQQKELNSKLSAVTLELQSKSKEVVALKAVLKEAEDDLSKYTTQTSDVARVEIKKITAIKVETPREIEISYSLSDLMKTEKETNNDVFHEFFQLTFSSFKLNARNFVPFEFVNDRLLYEKVKQLNLPYHKFYTFIESELRKFEKVEDISLDKDYC